MCVLQYQYDSASHVLVTLCYNLTPGHGPNLQLSIYIYYYIILYTLFILCISKCKVISANPAVLQHGIINAL